MSEIRASMNPASSKTALAASSSRARVCAPFRERGPVEACLGESVRDTGASSLVREAYNIDVDIKTMAGSSAMTDIGLRA